MRKKKLCITGIATLLMLAVLALYLIPLRTEKLELHMQGQLVTEDGSQEIAFTVTGQLRGYLLKADQLLLEQVDFNGALPNARVTNPPGGMSVKQSWSMPPFLYTCTGGQDQSGYLILAGDQRFCVVSCEENDQPVGYILATLDGKGDLDALREQYLKGDFTPWLDPTK